MGLFDAIGRAVQDGKEKAAMQAAPLIRQVEERDLPSATKVICQEFGRISIAAKAKVTQAYRKRINSTSDVDELYWAFEEAYNIYRRKQDMTAYNLAQHVGKRLYEIGDSRIEARENDNGFTSYRPAGGGFY